MDILYIIGEQSAKQNELKFSLRTIERNCKNVGRIFICGYLPDYIDETKVTFIPCEDIRMKAKQQNILNCIKQTILNSDISDDFLYSSDDHLYIGETDFENYPYFLKGDINDTIEEEYNWYKTHMVATRNFLKQYGLPTKNFAWHGNTHFNKTKFLEIMPLVDHAIMTIYGVEPTCLMLNAMLADIKYKFDPTTRKDVKITEVKDWHSLMKYADERECISFSDEAWESGCKKMFIEHYNHKSKWEK